MRRSCFWGLWSVAALSLASAHAEVTVETVVEGLSNPSGVAVQPETGHVFVSDSAAGRVIRVVDGKVEDVITGFPQDVYGEGPKYKIGPLGLAFLDKDTLVVGGGGLPDGEELLRVYTVPAAGGEAIQADKMKEKAAPLAATDEVPGEGNFFGVAVTPTAVFVTCNGDDTKGWVLRAKHTDKLEALERFIPTKEAVGVDAPVGITISPRGEVVVGQMGEITVPKDSLLSFYGANGGKLLLNLETGLFDITALAYSKTGNLYALDFAWMAADEGGLFRIDSDQVEGQQACKAVKIVGLDKPTAMAFAPSGEAYITVIGPAQGEADKTGKLLKINAGL